MRAGCPITFQKGIGRWATPAEADAALAGRTATITVDGVPVQPVTYEGITLHTGLGAPGYGNRARATWTATPGAHRVVGVWSGDCSAPLVEELHERVAYGVATRPSPA